MTRSGLALVLIRLIAVWFGTFLVTQSMTWLSVLVDDRWAEYGNVAIVQAFPTLTYAIAVAALFAFAPRLARIVGDDELADARLDRFGVCAVAFQCTGILLIESYAVPPLLGLISAAASNGPWPHIEVTAGLGTILGVLLVWKPKWFSRRVCGPTPERDEPLVPIVRDAVLAVVGVFVVVSASLDIVRSLGQTQTTSTLFGLTTTQSGYEGNPWLQVANVTRLALGVGLVMGPRRVMNTWKRVLGTVARPSHRGAHPG